MKKQEIVLFFETSAKAATNVNKAFDEVAKQLFMDQIKRKRQNTETLPGSTEIVALKP